METAALHVVREQIEALYADRGKDFLLPARYTTLVNVESSLLASRKARQLRKTIEERRIAGPHATPHVAVPHAHSG
ncbi:MAG: hypothetical protein QOC92_2890 [Acidimicrobiaceae bacterium]|jgi:hypothetical protein